MNIVWVYFIELDESLDQYDLRDPLRLEFLWDRLMLLLWPRKFGIYVVDFIIMLNLNMLVAITLPNQNQ